jgi:hypothetical protein
MEEIGPIPYGEEVFPDMASDIDRQWFADNPGTPVHLRMGIPGEFTPLDSLALYDGPVLVIRLDEERRIRKPVPTEESYRAALEGLLDGLSEMITEDMESQFDG